MSNRGPYRIPPTSALIAFESAARHGNFSRAARELRTSQSAISRHIAGLEQQLSTRLFDRSRTGVSLTDAGNRYRDAVATGLGAIHAGAAEVAELSDDEQVEVVIACSEEVSHIFMMPRYDAFRKVFGERVRIRILTYHYSIQYLPPEPVADLVLAWNVGDVAPEDHVVIYREAVRPYCSPSFAEAHADILNGPVTGWGELTFLDLARPNEGWASWEDWFKTVERPDTAPQFVGLRQLPLCAGSGRRRARDRDGLVSFHRASCRNRRARPAHAPFHGNRQLLLRPSHREGSTETSRTQVSLVLRADGLARGKRRRLRRRNTRQYVFPRQLPDRTRQCGGTQFVASPALRCRIAVGDDDLAEVRAGGEVTMGIGRLVQGEAPVDHLPPVPTGLERVRAPPREGRGIRRWRQPARNPLPAPRR